MVHVNVLETGQVRHVNDAKTIIMDPTVNCIVTIYWNTKVKMVCTVVGDEVHVNLSINLE